MTYPKFQAPLTWDVYAQSNARAERWMRRTFTARAERDALEVKLEAANKKLKEYES